MTVRSLFCPREWDGTELPTGRCPKCAAPWHMHRRAGIAQTLGGCGLPGHWTAGGPPWDGKWRPYWCGACEAQPVSAAGKLDASAERGGDE